MHPSVEQHDADGENQGQYINDSRDLSIHWYGVRNLPPGPQQKAGDDQCDDYLWMTSAAITMRRRAYAPSRLLQPI
jgi:hypothetical protein